MHVPILRIRSHDQTVVTQVNNFLAHPTCDILQRVRQLASIDSPDAGLLNVVIHENIARFGSKKELHQARAWTVNDSRNAFLPTPSAIPEGSGRRCPEAYRPQIQSV